jgi:class 3 adenylate cyclase
VDSNHKAYAHESSFARIDAILALPSGNFEETNYLPDRDKLTFTNGYYSNCTAIFADIRDSSTLPETYKRPALAKIYRAYLSEVVAILNGDPNTREINIAGDAAWAVVNTPYKSDVDSVFSSAARIHSMIKVLNYKLTKAGFSRTIKVGIGASWGRALMIKAGYSGSGINDVVYMGDVVNEAAKLANKGSNGYGVHPIMVSSSFYGNLKEESQALLSYNYSTSCYSGNVVNAAMDAWHEANCPD